MARQAQYQGAVARRQAEIQTAQLEQDARLEAIKAQDEEKARRDRFKESISSMRALNRGRDSGHFLTMIDADEEALRFDLGQIRLGLSITQSNIKSQIAINTVGAAGVGADADMHKKAGIFGAGTTLLKGHSEYKMSKKGEPKPTETTTFS